MRALIVEDDLDLNKNLRLVLDKTGFEADGAANGQEALDMARRTPYDLILLDVMMPGLDGYTVLRTLRKEGHESPIFMVTCMGGERDKLQGFADGADDYIVKPFSIDELKARVRVAMSRTQKANKVLAVGDLRLDTAKSSVERNGQVIELRQKECELLEYFMCHPGEMLSKERIARHVWGLDFDIQYNAIEAHVKNLRAKLDRPGRVAPGEPRQGRTSPEAGDRPDHSLIETVRGLGYLLKV